MTREEIEDQIDLWASAAERACKAGFDAVEMNHGTCHQGNTFLSRVWNRRDDEYGPQSLENRTRFLRDIIAETKRRCGPGFAVHALINVAEYNHPLATTIDEGAGMAVLIGEVADGINCRGERYGHRGGLLQPDRLFYPEPPVDLPAGLDWSRKGVGATVPLTEAVQAGRRHRPGVDGLPARPGPRRGVPAARQPRLRRHDAPPARRSRSAAASSWRAARRTSAPVTAACTASTCATATRSSSAASTPPWGARPTRSSRPGPVTTRKKVLVVGGGPAGMEAARVAARRGHQVALYEQDDRLGGLVPLAAVVKDLETQEMVDSVAYLKKQLEKEHVAVRLGQKVTPELVERLKPDVLVIATGAAHTAFDVPVADGGKVVATEKLHGLLKRALRVLTPGAGEPAVGLLDAGRQERRRHRRYAARLRARRVPDEEGPPRGRRPRRPRGRARRRHDRRRPREPVAVAQAEGRDRVGAGGRTSRSSRTGLKVRIPDSRTYVLEGRQVLPTQDWAPDAATVAELSPLVAETHVVGSAQDPGLIVDAVREGARAGYAI